MRIWQVTGSIDAFINEKTGQWTNGDPTLLLHAGPGTLHEARKTGKVMGIIRGDASVLSPLLAVHETPSVVSNDILPSDAPGLLVGVKFIQEFSREIEEHCREYVVHTAPKHTETLMVESREQLLARADQNNILYLLYPKRKIEINHVEMKGGKVFVSDDISLPPFFRTQLATSGILVTDNIKERIEQSGLRGADFNYNIDFAIESWRDEVAG